jgi:hypothetical protein
MTTQYSSLISVFQIYIPLWMNCILDPHLSEDKIASNFVTSITFIISVLSETTRLIICHLPLDVRKKSYIEVGTIEQKSALTLLLFQSSDTFQEIESKKIFFECSLEVIRDHNTQLVTLYLEWIQ